MMPEGEEQHQEHEQGGNPLRRVEVVMDDLHHVAAVIERLQDEGVRAGDERVGHRVGIFRAEGDVGEHHVPSVVLFLDVIVHQFLREDLRLVQVTGLIISVDERLEGEETSASYRLPGS